MSTDDPNPAGSSASGAGEPGTGDAVVPPVLPAATPTDGVGYGVVPGAPGSGPGGEPGWATRHRGALVAVLVAVVVAAIAIAGLILWRGAIDEENRATEALVIAAVTERGGQVQSVECDGDTCAAIVGGQAYTVLVQDGDAGERHVGMAAYVGD